MNLARSSSFTTGQLGSCVSATSIALNHGWRAAAADSRDTPGFRRPNTWSQRPRLSSSQSNSGVACFFIIMGTKSDGTSPKSIPRNPGSATPTIVIG